MRRIDPHARTIYLAGLCLLGGMVGALANSLLVWFFGYMKINSALGVAISPKLAWLWLRPRLLWGALWGLPFTAMVQKNWGRLYLAGFFYSLLPTFVQLFYVFPVLAQKGVLGAQLGRLTFLLVLLFNSVWGLTLAWVVRVSASRR
jgi:hypothetical protein